MLAVNAERVHFDRLEDGTERHYFGCVDFHSVDLKQNKLTRCCFPSMIMVELSNAMVSLNEFIYIVGGVTPSRARSPDIQLLQSASPLSNRTYYFGGSSLDMSDEAAVWCPSPVFIEDQTSSNYVSFLGKIYNFGSDRLAPEVLDRAVGHCKLISPIPPSLVGCSVSIPVLPDPSNKRILMRLYGGPLSLPSLYAFTPADVDGIGTWECLTPDFQVWADSAAVVNGVIYFHCHKFPSLLRAFHIAKKKWLKVWWDSCFKDKVDMSCFKDKVDMNVERIHFDAMLHLGNNILCFAGWTPIYPPPTVPSLEIVFFKFEVLDTGETVIVKACDSYSYELPKTNDVLRFLSV